MSNFATEQSTVDKRESNSKYEAYKSIKKWAVPLMGVLALSGAAKETEGHNAHTSGPLPAASESGYQANEVFELNFWENITAPASVNAIEALPRSTVDRPDDVSGPQVHYIYATPSDGPDRQLDTDGSIESSVRKAQDWMASQAETRSMRVDTYNGSLDISFFRSQRSGQALGAYGRYIVNEMRNELWAAGFSRDSNKILAVYYDGTYNEGCGAANWPPQVPGNTGMIVLPRCAPLSNSILRSTDLSSLHEVLHATGQVPLSAPHSNGEGHTNDDNRDFMNQFAGSGANISDVGEYFVLDAARDDYYHNLDPWLTNNHRRLSLDISGDGEIATEPSPSLYLGPETPCDEDCEVWFHKGDAVELQAQAFDNSRFVGWESACEGKNDCKIIMDSDKAVQAKFEPAVNLNVRIKGKGAVRVLGQGVCKKTCNYQFRPNASANMLAQPASNQKFVRWVGGCATRPKCNIKVTRNRQVSAVFARK